MKITTTALLIYFISLFPIQELFSQEPSFEWGIHLDLNDTSYYGDHSPLLAIDNKGNLYAAGFFYDTVDFDPSPDSMILSSFGNSDIFIQKIDSNGNLLWVKQIGGSKEVKISSIAINRNGNIYSTGHFSGGVDFDPGLGVEMKYGIYDENIFIHKLDSNGNFEWVKLSGGHSQVDYTSSNFDRQGNFYTTGVFCPSFYPSNGPSLTCKGATDAFIQKIDTAGDVAWVKQIGEDRVVFPFTTGDGVIYPSSIVLDNVDNIYIVGTFQDTIDFDPGSGVSELYSTGYESFILKLDANGDFLWVKQIGKELSATSIRELKIDQNGNLYMTGLFTRTIDFDPGINVNSLTAVDVQDAFVLKLNKDGNYIWAKQFGGVGVDEGSSLTVDNRGNLFVTGVFSELVDFDPGLDTFNLFAGNIFNTFMLKLDTDGNFKWVRQLEGTGYNGSRSIVSDNNENVYTSGNFIDTLDFDTGIGTKKVISKDFEDIFIHKHGRCKRSFSNDVQTACESYTWVNGKTYTASNSSAKDTLTNAQGCDSIISLNLTILGTSITTDVQEACNSYKWINDTTYTSSNNSAKDTLTSAFGCDSIVNLDLTINKVSDFSTTANDFTIIANNVNASKYQWLDCDSIFGVIAGATSRSFTAPENGSYAVELTENGCVDTSVCVAITVGFNENGITSQFEIYPNPTIGDFQIVFEETVNQSEISIFNIHGKLVDQSIYQSTKRINLSIVDQTASVYFVQIKTSEGTHTVRMVKK